MGWSSANKIKNRNQKFDKAVILATIVDYYQVSQQALSSCLVSPKLNKIKSVAVFLLYCHTDIDFRGLARMFHTNNFYISNFFHAVENDESTINADVQAIRGILKSTTGA